MPSCSLIVSTACFVQSECHGSVFSSSCEVLCGLTDETVSVQNSCHYSVNRTENGSLKMVLERLHKVDSSVTIVV